MKAVAAVCTILALLAATGCGGPATRPTVSANVPPKSEVAASAGTEELALRSNLEERCGTCHNEAPGRPTFSGTAPLSREGAVRAALALASMQMPPAGSGTLLMSDREALIASLCKFGADDAPTCIDLIAPRQHASLVKHPQEFLRGALAAAPGRPEVPVDPHHGGDASEPPLPILSFLTGGHIPKTARVVRLDPTYQLLIFLLAVETCAPRSGEVDSACVERMLDRDAVRAPTPSSK